jgi:hypothetical protein
MTMSSPSIDKSDSDHPLQPSSGRQTKTLRDRFGFLAILCNFTLRCTDTILSCVSVLPRLIPLSKIESYLLQEVHRKVFVNAEVPSLLQRASKRDILL